MGYFVSGGEVTARKVDRREGEVVNVVCSSCVMWYTLQPPFKNGVNPLDAPEVRLALQGESRSGKWLWRLL